ncbi:MAG: transglycosylase domain-containing protein [Candidatus Levybacteria bacterium]|nr:transglycosylase domain-containing protein [Candidatus Levybacteria bacterium]
MKVSRLIRIQALHFAKKVSKFIRRHKLFLGIFLVATIALSITIYFFILKDLPLPTKLSSSSAPQSTQIFDRNQKLLYSIYSNKNQTFIPLSSIPKHVQEASIAIEDKDFYKHGAIDFRGISRALVAIIVRKELQGGSTLTQQLVKNSLLTPERTIPRKIKEIILSFATEALYSKDKILEMYLNQIPYGGTAYGIEAASQTYFGKKAQDLTLAQSALLAGLPEAPTTNSPFGSHPEFAKQRQETILNKMYEQKYITKKERDSAIKENLKFKKLSNNISAPHFVLYIKDLLTKKYGEKMVEEGGLRVITSLDSKIQEASEEIVLEEVDSLKSYHATNGAAVVTNPATGEILAMVGSKNYFDTSIDGNVNIALSLRQPGSSIKPINYAVGLIKGYSGASAFVDEPICFPTDTGKQYCPLNYDGKFHGVTQMRYALGNSINIPAIKMLKVNGVHAMIATASAMGITTFTEPEKYGLSLTLGGGEVTMLEMAQAYGVFANGGYKINIHPILKITDSRGKILEEYKPPSSPIFGKKVLPEGIAFIISDILADNNARLSAFGPNSSLRIPKQTVSVKTGTTNDYRDNWTIGYTPDFVVATWVGNNDNTPMNNLASGITGAAPIWNGIMNNLIKDLPPHPLTRPPSVIQKRVCSVSGLIPPPDGTPNRCETRFEYFIKGTEPTRLDPGLQKVKIDKDTNDLADPSKTDNIDERDNVIITDITNVRYCVTCPHPEPTKTPNP